MVPAAGVLRNAGACFQSASPFKFFKPQSPYTERASLTGIVSFQEHLLTRSHALES